MFIVHVLRACQAGCQMAWDVFVLQPLRGVLEILAGVGRAGPELVQAVSSASIQAVEQQLSWEGQARVHQGGALILSGLKRLTALAAIAVGCWLCWHPQVLCWLSAAWVLVMCLSVG
ncbi:MAG: hypothetical protein JNM56_00725 [Planctomycetia bacterium]|nr:hypothetical protein [Planctomycetia bacterium]